MKYMKYLLILLIVFSGIIGVAEAIPFTYDECDQIVQMCIDDNCYDDIEKDDFVSYDWIDIGDEPDCFKTNVDGDVFENYHQPLVNFNGDSTNFNGDSTNPKSEWIFTNDEAEKMYQWVESQGYSREEYKKLCLNVGYGYMSKDTSDNGFGKFYLCTTALCEETADNCGKYYTEETSCVDGYDNDNDGFTDCADSECSDGDACVVETVCGDGTVEGDEVCDTAKDYPIHNSLTETISGQYVCSADCSAKLCYDSDGGVDKNVYGKVYYWSGGDIYEIYDFCTPDNSVWERACSNGNRISVEEVCDDGSICSEGVCIDAGASPPTSPPISTCGDGTCDAGETYANCPDDCGQEFEIRAVYPKDGDVFRDGTNYYWLKIYSDDIKYADETARGFAEGDKVDFELTAPDGNVEILHYNFIGGKWIIDLGVSSDILYTKRTGFEPDDEYQNFISYGVNSYYNAYNFLWFYKYPRQAGEHTLKYTLTSARGQSYSGEEKFDVINYKPTVLEFVVTDAEGNPISELKNQGSVTLNIGVYDKDYWYTPNKDIIAHIYSGKEAVKTIIEDNDFLFDLMFNTGEPRLVCASEVNGDACKKSSADLELYCDSESPIGCPCTCRGEETATPETVVMNLEEGQSKYTGTAGLDYSFADNCEYDLQDTSRKICKIKGYFADGDGGVASAEATLIIKLEGADVPKAEMEITGKNADGSIPIGNQVTFDGSYSKYKEKDCTVGDCYRRDFGATYLDYEWFIGVNENPWGKMNSDGQCESISSEEYCEWFGENAAICKSSDCSSANSGIDCTCPGYDSDGQIYSGVISNEQKPVYTFSSIYACGDEAKLEYSSCTVTLTVTDKFSGNLQASETFEIDLGAVINKPPVIQEITYGVPQPEVDYSFDIKVNDEGPVELTVEGNPAGSLLEKQTDVANYWKFIWPAPPADATATLKFTAKDNGGLTDIKDGITLSVGSNLRAKIASPSDGADVQILTSFDLISDSSYDSDDKIEWYIWEIGYKGEPWGTIKGISGDYLCINDEGISFDYGNYQIDGTLSSGTPCGPIVEGNLKEWNIYPSSIVKKKSPHTYTDGYNSLDDCANKKCTIRLTVVTASGKQTSDSVEINLATTANKRDLDGDGTFGEQDKIIFRELLLGKNPDRVKTPSELTINGYIKFLRGDGE